MAALTIRGVRKRFGMQELLKGIDLQADSGEFLVLVGSSGCGKSNPRTFLDRDVVLGIRPEAIGAVTEDGFDFMMGGHRRLHQFPGTAARPRPHPGERHRARHGHHAAAARALVPGPGEDRCGPARQCIPDAIEPEEIARLGLFLASDDSRLVTKQCFMVNGGSR